MATKKIRVLSISDEELLKALQAVANESGTTQTVQVYLAEEGAHQIPISSQDVENNAIAKRILAAKASLISRATMSVRKGNLEFKRQDRFSEITLSGWGDPESSDDFAMVIASVHKHLGSFDPISAGASRILFET